MFLRHGSAVRLACAALALTLLATTTAAARTPGGPDPQDGFRVLTGRAALEFHLPADVRPAGTWRDESRALTYHRYQQLGTDDVPVDGGQLTLVDRDGETVLVAGSHFQLSMPVNRTLVDQPDAVAIARAAPAVEGAPPLDEVPAETLVSRTELRLDPQSARLFQRVESGAPGVYVIHHIDAETGAVLAAWNGLDQATPGWGTGVRGDRKSLLGEQPDPVDNLTSKVSGTWRMRTADGRMVTLDAKGRDQYGSNLKVLSDKAKKKWKNDNDWAAKYQRAAVDAQYYASLTDDWYRNPANVGGFDFVTTDCVGPDPALGTIRNVVHFDVPPYHGYANAFWDPMGKFMVYGDGRSGTTTYMSGGQDVVSHELTHAVTQCRAPLDYTGMSGALNEAMSDIIATTIEWQVDEPTTSNCRRLPDQAGCPDWWIGEDVIVGGPRFGFRNLQAPGATGQPGHWQDRQLLTDPFDNHGVHINSTIVSHAFYLMASGGRNARCAGPTDPALDCDVVVPGVGVSDSVATLSAAWAVLPTNATFCNARDATLAQAEVLFPASARHQAAAELAWSAVGLGPSTCPLGTFRVTPRSAVTVPGGSATLAVNAGGVTATVASPASAIVAPDDGGSKVTISVPVGMADGSYVVAVSDGSTTRYAVLLVDATGPATAVGGVGFTGGTVSVQGAVPLSVGWTVSDAVSGIASASLERSSTGVSGWTVVATSSTGGPSEVLIEDGPQWFRVSATDAAGNVATSATSGPWTVSRFQEGSATYKRKWSALAPSQGWGSVRTSTKRRAKAKFAFTGTDVAWVSIRATDRGKVKVFIDGKLRTKLDLHAPVSASNAQQRRVVFAAAGLAPGVHKLRIVVLGTAGRPRVDVDGFLVLAGPG